MFSICIPTLNNADYLVECIACIDQTQKYNNQIVIYDNESTDDTEDKLQMFFQEPEYEHLDIDYVKGPNKGQYHALDNCYSRARHDLMFRLHTDMMLCVYSWEDYFLRAIKKAAHPWKWLMGARSIEPILGHTAHHIIEDYGQNINEYHAHAGELFEKYFEDGYQDHTIVTGVREPMLMHKKLYEQFDREAMLTYKAYCGDDHTCMAAYHAGVRQFWTVRGVLVYHIVGKKGGQTNTSKDSQDKDENWPYDFFVDYWRKHGYPDARHPGQWHPELIPQYIEV